MMTNDALTTVWVENNDPQRGLSTTDVPEIDSGMRLSASLPQPPLVRIFFLIFFFTNTNSADKPTLNFHKNS
jgi:hypothetical protein